MGESAVAIVQEALLGQVAASAGAALLVSDDTLRYVAANDAACELLGYPRDELLKLRVPTSSNSRSRACSSRRAACRTARSRTAR
jgi:PAS domain S-box-containing protein